MKKMQKRIISVIVVLVAVAGIGYVALNQQATNKELLQMEDNLILQQARVELVSEGYTLENPNVILNPYGNSPLTAMVLFETEAEVSPKVTIVGKDAWTTFTHTFEAGTKHMLSIYGLYADSENTVIIECGDSVKEITIKTDKLPANMPLPTEVYANKEKLSNELYFYTPSSVGPTCAYDVNGDVRWYLTNYALWKIDHLKNGHLLLSTERLVNAPYYMTGLYEIDLLGKIYVEYSLPGGYHHDYYEMADGNLLVATDDFDNKSGTVEDYIVELDRDTGEIVKRFDLKDVLKMQDGKSESWIAYDWFHNNSVWYDPRTNSITLSGRHQDAVINIDYETGVLNWIIGDSTSWSEEYQKYFFTPVGEGEFEWQWSQHAAMITPEGYVFILDNGNNKSKNKEEYVSAENSYTRGVMYKINTQDMTIEQVWEYGKERGSEFYSPYISDVDYLAKDHYIVHSGGIVYVNGKNSNYPAGLGGADKLVSDTVELINDEVVFELKLPTNNYRVEKMSLYAENEKFSTQVGLNLGTLGETEVTEKKWGPILSAKDINEVAEQYKLSFSREMDRLVVKGVFTKEHKVNVLLYQNMNSNVYNVRISKKPYTAMCVYVFTEEDTGEGISVTKYINAEGLKGKYSVYLEIDGVMYTTGKYVEF